MQYEDWSTKGLEEELSTLHTCAWGAYIERNVEWHCRYNEKIVLIENELRRRKSSPPKCKGCGQEKDLIVHKNLLGEEMVYCSDCS